MSEIPILDEFTKEMMTHYLNDISTTLPKIENLSPEDWIQNIDSWKAEAESNQFPFFAKFLSDIKQQISDHGKSIKDFKINILTYTVDLASNFQDSEKWSEKNKFQVKLSPTSKPNETSDKLHLISNANSSPENNKTTISLDNSLPSPETKTKSANKKTTDGSNDPTDLSKSTKNLYLICFIGNQEFILPVQSVIEVSSFKNSFPLPEPKSGIEGLVNFRGEAIPIVNLNDHDFMTMNSKDPLKLLVVCEFNESRFGIRITKTDEVVEIDSTTFQQCDDNFSQAQHPVVTHFFIHKNRTVFNFDITRLFAA